MFEPFIWMFKAKNFKKHFLYLFLSYFKFLVPALLFCYVSLYFRSEPIVFYILLGLAFLSFVAAPLCVSGYFWELTYTIIHRDLDVKAANIYDGKINIVENITLPELKTFKLIWRGFASIVATILMFLPLVLFLYITGVLNASFTDLYRNFEFYNNAYWLLYIIFLFLVPALLWNYARTNSVVATMDISKAIYVTGNYTFKYIWNIFRYALIYVICSYLISRLIVLLGLQSGNFEMSLDYIARLSLFGFIIYVYNLFSLYIYAYLLGTITPPAE